MLAVLREVRGNGEDAGVVVAQAQTLRQHRSVRVGEFDAQCSTSADRHGKVKASVLDTQLIEVTQRLTGEVAEFGVVTLRLEFGDHHHRNDDGVLGEPEERPRIAEQDRGIEYEGAQVLIHLRTLVDALLLLWCSRGHNPLPPRVIRPAVSSWPVPRVAVGPTRPGALPDVMTVRLGRMPPHLRHADGRLRER